MFYRCTLHSGQLLYISGENGLLAVPCAHHRWLLTNDTQLANWPSASGFMGEASRWLGAHEAVVFAPQALFVWTGGQTVQLSNCNYGQMLWIPYSCLYTCASMRGPAGEWERPLLCGLQCAYLGVVMQTHNTGACSVGFVLTKATPLCSLGNSLFLLPMVDSVLAVWQVLVRM